jgi:serine/threonine-protein kinase
LYALTLGARLAGRYEITGMLGRGGMGVVYLAHDLELDETVALKVLRTEIAGSEEAARRFRSEIKLARRIRHRNVCGIHEYGQDGPLRFIVMEYVEGSTLRQLLRQRGRFSAAQAFDVAIEVAEGLQAVHDAGILHRDLKATNVMLDRGGAVRLMDFGIAKQLQQQETTGITATAQMVGTPEYMSPEQVRSEKLDGRSDVYSLGILVFELFTGELPFHGDTPMSVILAHLETPPPLDGARATWLPRSLVPVLRKALAKDRHERYRSPRELAEALRSAREALTGPTLVQPRPAFDGGATARAPAPTVAEPQTAPAPTPVGTPTPVVAATTPLPRPALAAREEPRAAATRSPIRSPRRLPAFRYLVVAGALVGGLGLALASRLAVRSPSNSPLPNTAGDTPAPVAPATTLAARRASVTPAPTPAVPVTPPAPAPSRAVEATPRQMATPPPIVTPPPIKAETHRTVTPSPPRRPAVPAPAASADMARLGTANGTLKLRVVPWADVSLDGRALGTTPLKPLPLAPGAYTVRLQHPSYRPLQRKVNVRAGEVFVLDVDLAQEAFPIQAKEP